MNVSQQNAKLQQNKPAKAEGRRGEDPIG